MTATVATFVVAGWMIVYALICWAGNAVEQHERNSFRERKGQ